MNRAQMEKAPAHIPSTTSKVANRSWIVSLLFLCDRKLASHFKEQEAGSKSPNSELQLPAFNLQLPLYLGMSRRAA